MENKKLKNLDQLLVKLEAKKITLIRNQKYEEAKVIRDQMVEINEKLQNLFEKYNNLNDD